MDRRSFLKRNALLFGGAFIANWGTRAQIREYKQPAKPLLSEANLNQFFEQAHARGDVHVHAARVRTDVNEFLDQSFSLSPQQKATLARLSPQQKNQLSDLMAFASKPGSKVSFKFVNVAAQCRTAVTVVNAQQQQKSMTL